MSDDIVAELRRLQSETTSSRRMWVETRAADEIERLREALEWLRHWRTKDHESIDCCIEHALGQAETCSVCHPHGNATQSGEQS